MATNNKHKTFCPITEFFTVKPENLRKAFFPTEHLNDVPCSEIVPAGGIDEIEVATNYIDETFLTSIGKITKEFIAPERGYKRAHIYKYTFGNTVTDMKVMVNSSNYKKAAKSEGNKTKRHKLTLYPCDHASFTEFNELCFHLFGKYHEYHFLKVVPTVWFDEELIQPKILFDTCTFPVLGVSNVEFEYSEQNGAEDYLQFEKSRASYKTGSLSPMTHFRVGRKHSYGAYSKRHKEKNLGRRDRDILKLGKVSFDEVFRYDDLIKLNIESIEALEDFKKLGFEALEFKDIYRLKANFKYHDRDNALTVFWLARLNNYRMARSMIPNKRATENFDVFFSDMKVGRERKLLAELVRTGFRRDMRKFFSKTSSGKIGAVHQISVPKGHKRELALE